jgi:hypothetical protein
VLPVVGAPKIPTKYKGDSGSAETDSSFGVRSVEGAFTLTGIELDVPPPGAGFMTERLTAPELTKSADGIVAISSVAEMYVLEINAEFALTVEDGRKSEPVIWTWVSGEASGTVEGVSDPTDGARLSIENNTDVDVPPPGVGFETVIV